MRVISDRRRKSDARRLQAYGLYKSGKTIAEISREMRVSSTTAKTLAHEGERIQKFIDGELNKNQHEELVCPHCGKTIKVGVSISA